ncbi:Hypothetical predicted protein [Cloeon dipterum]|uniref:Peptidase S1 domain-containing protein n=1 Tax=Cloeon dipterum TaxID=197152 RepID=A0A8S1DUU7_9INSE|nr:Hypothetical predicted protein [Cloeon dipterum]
MSPTMILCLVACSMLVPWATSQTIPIDAAPTEYPYAVKTFYVNQGISMVGLGLAVSKHYLLASAYSKYNWNLTAVELTDQQGVVHPVFNVSDVGDGTDPFIYFKTCKKFSGPMYSLKVAGFNNFSETVNDAEIIFFSQESNVLKKIPVAILNQTACETETNATIALQKLCIAPIPIANICKNFYGSTPSPFEQQPMVGIKGQVHGSRHLLGCDGQNNWTSIGKFYRFDYNIPDIIGAIPVVDLKD